MVNNNNTYRGTRCDRNLKRFLWGASSGRWHTVSPQVNLHFLNRSRFKEIDSPAELVNGWEKGWQLPKHPLSCAIPNSTKVLFWRFLEHCRCPASTFTQKPSLSLLPLPARRFCFSFKCPRSRMSSRSKAPVRLCTTRCSFLPAGDGDREREGCWSKESLKKR